MTDDSTFDALRAIEAKAQGLNLEADLEEAAPDETPPLEEQAPETPAEEAAPEAESEPELILGKYKTLEEAYSAFEEAQRTIGSMRQEVGQTRQEMDQLRQAVQQQQLPGQQSELDDLILEDPAAAAERALQLGDNHRFQQAVEAWNAVAPGAPALWWDNKQLRQQFTELSESVTERTAPSVNLAVQDEQRMALANMAAKHEDFPQIVAGLQDETRLNELVQKGFPAQLLEGLDKPGNLAQRETMLATLYAFAKADQAGLLPEAVKAAVDEVKNETVAAKQAATAPAGSAGAPVTEEPDGNTKFRDAFRRNFGLEPLIKD